MAQVETQSPFQHSSQHTNYYYPSTSSSHSGSSSSSNSHHSSPRNSSIIPQRYYSPTQHYSPDEQSSSSYHNPAYRSPYPNQPSRSNDPDDEDPHESPFPAYDHATSSLTPTPELIEDDGEEDEPDYDELEEDAPLESPNSLRSTSPSATFPPIADDLWTERGPAPSRQVDYLSHDWAEPDIWSSWRYVRKEKAGYPQNAARLENASWRTWAKSKYKLKTITPETLNWLKDCDVTWLYGPLQSQSNSMAREPISPVASEPDLHSRKLSRSSSFNVPSKPILKKRSHSEVMLSSLSGRTPGTLITRAAQVVQDERRRESEEAELREEQRKHPLTPTHVLRSQQRLRRKGSADLTSMYRNSPESPFNTNQSVLVSTRTDYFGHGQWTSSSSGGQTPSASKHIHFNDHVEQYIAVEVKDDEDNVAIDDEEESDDEGGLYMMRSKSLPKPDHHSTIAKLPATTLRPGDEPVREPPQMAFSFPPRGLSFIAQDDLNLPETQSRFYYEEGGGFSSSASPPKFPFQSKYPFDKDRPPQQEPVEENLDDLSFDHPFASQSYSENIPSNTSSAHTSATSSRRSSSLDLEEESQRRSSVAAIPIPLGNRTRDHPSSMLDDENEEGIGIVGLAADAISTAKDIVGVLWNAGWGNRRT